MVYRVSPFCGSCCRKCRRIIWVGCNNRQKTTNNDSPVEEPVVEVVNEDNVQEHISSFGANDNTEVVEQETIIVDPVEPEVLVEPIEPEESVEPEDSIEPEEPIFIDDLLVLYKMMF